MLRGRAGVAVFAAVFFEAGRNCAGGDERDAGFFAARRRSYRDAEQEAAGGAVSARSGGCGDRLGWILRIASGTRAAGGSVSKGSVGDYACSGFARSYAITF